MTPERHQEIARLYHMALELAPGPRIAFLETACADDQALRQEVESLLALDESAKDFIEDPALLVAAELLAEESALLPPGRAVGFYRIRASLGAGGMGEVYLAEDTRLGREIALKLLPARFTQDTDRLRWFEQEARAASALNHPNIITIHDIGQVEGHHFIATEFIDGQTLRQKIDSQPLKLDEALDVALQAANALAAAHAAGVVHRDIKPENIMLRTDGYVKVLDFGLAKLTQVSETGVGGEESITAAGAVIGTVRYMSPEQARGQKVDARSDLFSLGVVLYEMLTGRSPFAGATTADAIVAILSQEPPLNRDMPKAPEALKQIVIKSLRKDRDERYQTAREMVTDLNALKHRLDRGMARKAPTKYLFEKVKKRSAILALAITLLVLAAVLYFPMSTGALDSIAVLPFVNENKDPNTEYLSDGISDSLISRLRSVPSLRVISLSAILTYKGKPLDVQAVGRELNVRTVLSGSLTLRGDILFSNVELRDARDNRLLWSKQYSNVRLSQLLELQDEIARDISRQLGLRLTGEQQELLVKHETENAEAHVLYLKGRSEWDKVTVERLEKSKTFFLEAVKIDPNYARAYAGLADSYSLLGEISAMRPIEAFHNAELNSDKALSLDDTLAEAWVSRGIVRLLYKWDWAGAQSALKQAMVLDRNNPDVYHFYAHYLQFMGRAEEGITETQHGVDLAPNLLLINAELGWAYYVARQYDRAIRQGRETLKLDPNYAYASWSIAQAYEQQQRYQEALDELNKAKASSGDWSWIVADLGYIYAKQGRRADSQKIIGDLQERAKGEYIDPVLIAYIYIALDNKDEAFRWLDKAVEEQAALLPWLKVEPKFDPLRGDERFTRLTQRLKLP